MNTEFLRNKLQSALRHLEALEALSFTREEIAQYIDQMSAQ
jgi:hypothetical protein